MLRDCCERLLLDRCRRRRRRRCRRAATCWLPTTTPLHSRAAERSITNKLGRARIRLPFLTHDLHQPGAMSRKHPTLFDKFVQPMFVYRTEKYIKVDVFIVGVFYRLMQVLAVMLVWRGYTTTMGGR